MKSSFSFLQNKDMLALAIVTLFTVVVWIFIQAYNTATKKEIPPETQQLIAPIIPTVREDVLQKLGSAQP